MYKVIDNILYVGTPFIVNYGVSEGYVKKVLNYARMGKSSSWQNIPDTSDARKRLIQYDSIPLSTIQKYSIPSKEEILEQIAKSELAKLVIKQKGVKEYFENNSDTFDRAAEYARLVDWGVFLAPFTTRKAKDLRLNFSNLYDLYETALQCMKIEAVLKDRLKRVSNQRAFERDYIKPFKRHLNKEISFEQACDAIVDGRVGVKNALKRTPECEKIIISLYINLESDIKMLPEVIWSHYTSITRGEQSIVDKCTGELFIDTVDAERLPELCVNTVRNIITRPDIVAWADKFRHGSKYHNDVYRPYVHGTKPRYSLTMTSSDGQHVPLRLKINNKAVYKRAKAYLIFDVASEAIIGYAIGMEENTDLMRQAFKNLLMYTGGLVPIQNQLDNFGQAFKSELEEIYPIVSFCAPYNPQSKYAENYIGRLEEEQCRNTEGWLGGNIQDKTQNQKRNEDFEAQAYTYNEILAIYANWVKGWNNTSPKWSKAGKSRLEMLWEKHNPEAEQLSEASLVKYIGESTIRNISRGTIKLGYNGEDYEYIIPNYTDVLTKLKNGFSVRIRFMPALLDKKVWIYNYSDRDSTKDDELLTECISVLEYETQRAKAEQIKGIDDVRLAEQTRIIKRFDNWVNDQMQQYAPVALISNSPTMEEDEAEAILASGYTSKVDMNEAEAILTTSPRCQKRFELYEDQEEGGLIE